MFSINYEDVDWSETAAMGDGVITDAILLYDNMSILRVAPVSDVVPEFITVSRLNSADCFIERAVVFHSRELDPAAEKHFENFLETCR